jgi:hypothetical protein
MGDATGLGAVYLNSYDANNLVAGAEYVVTAAALPVVRAKARAAPITTGSRHFTQPADKCETGFGIFHFAQVTRVFRKPASW